MFLVAALLIAFPAVADTYKAAEITRSYVTGTSPTYILGLDNNLQICLALREEATPAKLAARGIPMSESQRVLLVAFNIIGRTKPGSYQCRIPVFEGEGAATLRAEAARVAKIINAKTAPQRERFVAAVREAGAERQAYAILGSLVLDGLVWRGLEDAGAMASAKPETMQSGSKLWSGIAWMVIPPPESKLGTNSITAGNQKLYITSSPVALDALTSFNNDLQRAVLDRAAGKPISREADAALRQMGLANGPLRIASKSKLYAAAKSYATAVAKEFARQQNEGKFAAIEDRSKATLILYHEVYPEMLRIIEREGTIAVPRVLKEGGRANLDELIFVVIGVTSAVGGFLHSL